MQFPLLGLTQSLLYCVNTIITIQLLKVYPILPTCAELLLCSNAQKFNETSPTLQLESWGKLESCK